MKKIINRANDGLYKLVMKNSLERFYNFKQNIPNSVSDRIACRN